MAKRKDEKLTMMDFHGKEKPYTLAKARAKRTLANQWAKFKLGLTFKQPYLHVGPENLKRLFKAGADAMDELGIGNPEMLAMVTEPEVMAKDLAKETVKIWEALDKAIENENRLGTSGPGLDSPS